MNSPDFNLIATAPDGPQKLRELILSLAVRGKLVPQDPNDEPASELLKRIAAEKARLVKAGEIKKPKPLPPIEPDVVPYELPMGWEWCRLGNVTSYIQRGKSPTYSDIKNIPVVSQKCVQWSGFDISRARFLEPDALEKYPEERFLRSGDLLWNSTGTGTIGRINLYIHEDNRYEKVVADGHVTVVRPLIVNPAYLLAWISSPFIQRYIEGRASGTTNQIELATSMVQHQIVPLPPVSEQNRIVNRIDELLSNVDELEAQRTHQNILRISTGKASLDALAEAETPKALQTAWQRLKNNFEPLFSQDGENIKSLRQAVLSLAVRGKLVPQDPNDEPAIELLKRIATEKSRLVKAGKIRYNKNQPLLERKNYQFRIPNNWAFIRLGSIVSELGDGLHGTPNYVSDSEIHFINGNNLSNGKIEIKNNTKSISFDEWKKYKVQLNSRSVLVSINGTIGNVAFYQGEKVVLGKSACYINLMEGISKYYVKIILESPYFYQYALEASTGTTINNLSLKAMRMLPVAVPPLIEQQRIVERVDYLMKVIEQLGQGIEQSRIFVEKYAEAVVANVG